MAAYVGRRCRFIEATVPQLVIIHLEILENERQVVLKREE